MQSNDPAETDIEAAVFDVVRQVPPGRVVTYGQVADMVRGVSLTARQVGAAMVSAPADVPWQRVVGAGGHLPIGKRSPELKMLQHRLLEQEGARFVGADEARVDMAYSQWLPNDDGGTTGDLFAE